jgi:2-oxoglutarate ferredoxin oxidoreductase subunit gamma
MSGLEDNGRYEVRLSGSGGQGIITAGIILAEAACVHEGYHAVQTQSYGPESRGGASKAEVVISKAEIDYPKVTTPDLLVVMTQEACDAYIGDRAEGGWAILDATNIPEVPAGENLVLLPLTELARQETGRAIVANIVALGALVELTGIVRPESMRAAVIARVPKGTEELNQKALAAGFAAVRQWREANG